MPNNNPETPGFVQVRGAREHNLKNVNVDIPRDALVVFTGVSGSGKSSLAFGTLYAEAQRRYLESVSPCARRLFDQMEVPEVDSIEGLPPAVALQQQRGSPTTRSSVGSVTTLSNLLRILYSRAGDYPAHQSLLYAESFSPNTPEGACPRCHGLGRIYDVNERSLVPDDSLTIRERAVAAWPTAWQGQNLRDILTTLGHDVDVPWRELPKKTRDWILFTDEQPTVPVYAGYDSKEVRRALRRKEEPSYQGTFTSAKRYVLETFSTSESALMKRRAAAFMISADCPECHGKRLRREALSVKVSGLDITEVSRLPLKRLATLFRELIAPNQARTRELAAEHPEKLLVLQRIADDMLARLETKHRTEAAARRAGLVALARCNTQQLERARCGRAARRARLRDRCIRLRKIHIGEPSSNLATYTGLFDDVRKLFAATKAARARRYDAGRFSFNVAKGRCETCQGEGSVMVELLFLPSVYAPCPACKGSRYNDKTLEIKYRDKSIADVLAMTVDAAWEFFADDFA